jgi:all-trans-retinol 13,14-reductase
MTAGSSYAMFKGHDQKYDAIVIGSGMGGLSVAAILARHGKKVLLLERHFIIGGYTHAFERRGYEWDVGLHYVGDVHMQGTPLNKAFRYISEEKLEWAPLDDVYDRIVFGDKKFNYVRGRENLKAELKKHFPAEKDLQAIDKYFSLLDEVGKLGIAYYAEKVIPPFLAKIFGGWMRKKVLKYSDLITLDVLKSLTDNQELIGVLTSQYGDYGLIPSESSFYMHALLANHYMEGAGYPVGGATSIAKTVVPVIEKNGGKVLFNADVKEVLVEGNKAVGVQMADGSKLYSKLVISDAGVHNTFAKLIPKAVAEKHGLLDQLKELEPSAAHIGLYIGIKDSPENLKMPRCNYWIFPEKYDHDLVRNSYKNIDQEIPVAYVSFPAAKDLDSQRRHPGRATVEGIIIVPFEWFDQWKETSWKKRNESYEEMKKKVAEQMMEKIFSVEPQLRGKVDYYEVSTPLSTVKFTNHPRGEIYGVAHTPKRFRQRFLKPYTPVKNLFMTGQDVMIASIAGAMMGGILAASAILKKDVLSSINKQVK